jgi:hypothetical protein
VVNSSQGGGSKDTWVLADDDLPPAASPLRQAPAAARASAFDAIGRQGGPASEQQ